LSPRNTAECGGKWRRGRRPNLKKADAGPPVALTVDVHADDRPEDITAAAEWLAHRGLPGTFFVPSTLLVAGRYRSRLIEVPKLGHEVGSHTHTHGWEEMAALRDGDGSALRFLEHSKYIYEETYGCSPCSFRSPCWSALGSSALDELQRLGYAVDSSATPQRLPLLGSNPYKMAWAGSPRGTYLLRPGLVEVPTSTFIVPASSNTFRLLRRLSPAFLALLLAEARLLPDRVIVLQFHPADFCASRGNPAMGRPLRLGDFALRGEGGFAFRDRLLQTDPARIHTRMSAIADSVGGFRCGTLAEISMGLRG